jgi:ElaB/YqjD/DUF883 family membrane-anchored ribosome-binding protein
MANQQTLQGNWNEVIGKVKSKWRSITDEDLKSVGEDVNRLIGVIQRKTGEKREIIENYVEELGSSAASTLGRANEAVRDYAHYAAEAVQDSTHQAVESVREGYHDVEDMVRQRPAESLAVCFGVGIITGVVLGLLMRR